MHSLRINYSFKLASQC